jgi:hypothetical protein
MEKWEVLEKNVREGQAFKYVSGVSPCGQYILFL